MGGEGGGLAQQYKGRLGEGGGSGLRVTTHHVGGSGGMPPKNFYNFRCSENASDAFSGHSWLSTNMIEMTTFLMVIRHLTPIYTPSYTGADKYDMRVAVLQLESINCERK